MRELNIYLVFLSLLALLNLSSCAPVKGNVYPLPSAYLGEKTLFAELTRLCEIHPALAQLRIIGFSGAENLPIYALEIGANKSAKPLLIIGQHHGDEVLGLNISLAFCEKLITSYKSDPAYRKLLDSYRFWVIPTINPEGFRVVSSGEYQFKRKNNRDTNANKQLDLRTDGVDLNRNYPVFWDIDPDSNINSPYYKGSEPMSESETRAVISLAQKHNFELAIFLHSSASGAYSEKLYLPAQGNDSPLYLQTLQLAQNYAKSVKRDYGSGTYEVHTGISSEVGNARNFFFHRMGAKAFLVEVGGINKQGQSVIHPPEKMLHRIVQKHTRALGNLFLEYSAASAADKK
ncbi:MAG: M14 family metallopeptidase [Candidatus Cloacimonetes bacterium]|nr:M14 family metallopeptidase [Candidatus Cloacimonadota bacterium]